MVETFYAHLEFKAKDGKWSINLPFLCNQCGVCCTLDDFLVAGKVRINPLENPKLHAKLQALYDDLGRRWEVDAAKYDKFIQHTQCPFLVNKSCSIYAVRPEGCRQYPNTPFGMQTKDCEPLNRFKKQLAALKRGRKTKESYLFSDVTKPSRFSEEQFQKCLSKLQKAGVTEGELALFYAFNKQK
jgi:Fe-S-cluster containining protein